MAWRLLRLGVVVLVALGAGCNAVLPADSAARVKAAMYETSNITDSLK